MTKPLILVGHNNLSRSTFSARLLAGIDKNAFQIARLAEHPHTRGFDPAEEMVRIAAAERLIVLFPIHWYGPPSTLVRWTEDALLEKKGSPSFTALKGKPVQFIVSTGAPEHEYRDGGSNARPVIDYLAGLMMTFRYFGADVKTPLVYHATWQLDDNQIMDIGLSLVNRCVLS